MEIVRKGNTLSLEEGSSRCCVLDLRAEARLAMACCLLRGEAFLHVLSLWGTYPTIAPGISRRLKSSYITKLEMKSCQEVYGSIDTGRYTQQSVAVVLPFLP